MKCFKQKQSCQAEEKRRCGAGRKANKTAKCNGKESKQVRASRPIRQLDKQTVKLEDKRTDRQESRQKSKEVKCETGMKIVGSRAASSKANLAGFEACRGSQRGQAYMV